MNRIREYRPDDAGPTRACIIELQDFCKQIVPQIAAGSAVVDKYFQHLSSECAETDGNIYVAESDGQVIGMVCVFARVQSQEPDEEDYEYAYISDLVVLASHRNKGIGRRLLKRAEEHARSKGANLLRLSVQAGNAVARDLYRGYGFKEKAVIIQKEIRGPGEGTI
jgi:ribosomal protein S18 acetylase RimI-like enzyme